MSAEDGSPSRPPRRPIDGLVLVDKPSGITSNAALQRVKRAFSAAKAGHTGTLDPLATGLLPVCFGEATKFSAGLLDADKSYRATIHLGVATDTGDREGTVTTRCAFPTDRAQIESALDAFRGEILQRPHRYSAIKRDGRALYSYARDGVDVEIAARAVRILRLDVEHFEPPMLEIDVLCSKGTYIRSLAEDIGVRLGSCAHVAQLRRTRVGQLSIDDALPLETLESMPDAERDACIGPLSRLVERLQTVELDEAGADSFIHGRRIAIAAPSGLAADATVAVRTARSGERGAGERGAGRSDDGFLGLGVLARDGERTWLCPSRVIATRDRAVPAPVVSAVPRGCGPDRGRT